ncbi:hypothetical protein [Brevibacillus sp. Leaf182]|uniref:hypothetical protein n=1 Tax=Brevibacillus sp. Leaf182 TaxID=1736290 RepID=UPI001057F8F7|nr:hypothetical protein [Brevibacillus sp. Leaf182]
MPESVAVTTRLFDPETICFGVTVIFHAPELTDIGTSAPRFKRYFMFTCLSGSDTVPMIDTGEPSDVLSRIRQYTV